MARLIEELTRLPGIGPKRRSAYPSFDQFCPESAVQSRPNQCRCETAHQVLPQCFNLTEEDPVDSPDPKRTAISSV